MKKTLIRIFAILLTFTMLFTSPQFSSITYANDYQSTLDDLAKKMDALNAEKKKLDSDIAKAKNDKEKKLAEKNKLDKDIKITKQEIALLTERIDLLNKNIEEKEQQIIDAQDDIDINYDLFKKRLRAMYMTNNSSTLGLVLGAESFSDFLSKAEVLTSIAEHDKELIKMLTDNKRSIEEAKADVERDKGDLDDSKAQMQEMQNKLSGQLQSTVAAIQDIDKLAAEFAKDMNNIKKQEAEVQKEMDKVYALINSTGEYLGGVLSWPVPGFSRVSSDFGPRFNGTDYHTGIDIAGTSNKGIMGQKIAAAAAGTVAVVNTKYVQGRGYGIYVIVDHGGGVTTLYGHCSAVTVKQGQKVERGDQIAKVGSTGWSTGPHLHFEVRENGKYVNPWKYLKG